MDKYGEFIVNATRKRIQNGKETKYFHAYRTPRSNRDHHYSIDIKLMSIGKYATYI